MLQKFVVPVGLVTLAWMVACGSSVTDNAAIGGSLAASGGASAGGSPSGGNPSGGPSAGTGGGTSAGTGGADGSIDSSTLTWAQASLTNYESYPDPGSVECIEYSGCKWAGYFAAVDGKQTEQWVSEHNIVAVFATVGGSIDFDTYKLHKLRLRQGGDEIDVVVYDTCGDSDCSGCCTQNAQVDGNLIDIEKYTKARFNGRGDGTVEWACLDCD